MSRFDEPPLRMKLGEIVKNFTNSSFAMPLSMETSMAGARPIWELLNLTEEEYNLKYNPHPPVDVSGNPTLTGSTES